jgi:hypothetical protein
MSIQKHKLSFDPAESDDYDVVASYLRASDGTLITHTGGALDVNIATSDIQLQVDLSHTEDSVRLGDGTSFFTSTSENGDIALDVHLSNTEIAVTQGSDSPWSIDDGGGSLTVDAIDFDIRDLSASQDNVAISDGTDTLAVNGDGSLNAVVSATDLDIRDLTHATDSVKIGDGTDFLAVEADGSINVNASEAGYSSCNNAAVTITTSATDVVATELANRKELTIQNVGGKDIYIGCDNTVSLANGMLVPKGATASFRFGAGINVHAIADGASSEIRILELA